MPKFSIIIPVYNVAPYLRECLDSVWAQTFTDWEAICVDDGSTDGSGAILDEYREEVEKLGGGERRMAVLHQKNAGVSVARNAALDVAKGEWIMFLDGDDRYASDLLQRIDEKISTHPNVEVVNFSIKVVNGPQSIVRERLSINDGRILSGEEVLLDGNGPLSAYIWMALDKVYKRDFLVRNRVRFREGLISHEDTLFAVLVATRARRILVADSIVGYYYVQSQSSVTHVPSFKRMVADVIEVEAMKELYDSSPSSGLLLRIQLDAECLLRLGCQYGKSLRNQCIDYLAKLPFFEKDVLTIILGNCTWRKRLWIIAYRMAPLLVKRWLLAVL